MAFTINKQYFSSLGALKFLQLAPFCKYIVCGGTNFWLYYDGTGHNSNKSHLHKIVAFGRSDELLQGGMNIAMP